eukprot:UN01414
MDELGSAPRIKFDDQFDMESEQQGSWFGLAISGLKFLISNQQTNSLNTHNNGNSQQQSPQQLQQSQCVQPKQSQSMHNNDGICTLGPQFFKKQLYDIPEYQPTADHRLKTNARLTKQALQQFNGNFSNYWNQRSSLKSHHSSNAGDDDTSNAT